MIEDRQTISVRVSTKERKDIRKAAELEGLNNATWMRTALVRAARAVLRKAAK